MSTYSPTKGPKKKRRTRGKPAKAKETVDPDEDSRATFFQALTDWLGTHAPTPAHKDETVEGVPWEYFEIDDGKPIYLDEGFPVDAQIGTVEGYALTATDPEGVAHAHALAGDRDDILRDAARFAANEQCFVAVGRAMGVVVKTRSTVFREIATFKPGVKKGEVDIEFDDDPVEVRERRVTVSKADDEKQIVYGEVYAPIPFPDSDGELMSAAEIEKMAHGFLAGGRVNKIDTLHDNIENGSVVVESFIAEEGSGYIPGAWVIGVHVPDPEMWRRIKSGELNGFSMQSLVHIKKKQMVLDVPDEVKGRTEEAENDDGTGRHRHTYKVAFDLDGTFLGGSTSVDAGHGHDIKSMSITGWTRGSQSGEIRHRHRYSFLDKLFGDRPLDEVSGRISEAA